MSSRISGFYRLGVGERRKALRREDANFTAIDSDGPGGLTLEAADSMIENVVGVYGLPFAVAVNFIVDGTEVVVPMVIEEPSVVAAASNAARMARPHGFTTTISAPVMTGQIQITHVADLEAGVARLRESTPEMLAYARRLVPRLVDRGGGPIALEPRVIARSGDDGAVVVVHLQVDCRDAMGANVVNTLCEALADRIAGLCGGRTGLRILSNLTDARTVRVTCTIDDAHLTVSRRGGDGEPLYGADVRKAIAAASRFAELDPYRAATHNKGIMNGVDAVLVATGQDWRAVEAGAHAYAARSGSYRPLAVWREIEDRLVGELVMPLAVGTVGGRLHNHPAARLALELAQVTHADRLAAIAGAAGIATNLAALRALATEGIQRGHMALHARGIARAAGATGDLVEQVAAKLAAGGDVKLDRAHSLLTQLRTRP
jgi:hydroxymethylglutaryl-CoA reductase